MSEQRYRLEENNQTNELILWEDAKILNVFKSSYDNRKHLNIIVDRLNKQQATIKMYQRSIERREEQISIIKKYCLEFLTDEQFEIIKKALEDELV